MVKGLHFIENELKSIYNCDCIKKLNLEKNNRHKNLFKEIKDFFSFLIHSFRGEQHIYYAKKIENVLNRAFENLSSLKIKLPEQDKNKETYHKFLLGENYISLQEDIENDLVVITNYIEEIRNRYNKNKKECNKIKIDHITISKLKLINRLIRMNKTTTPEIDKITSNFETEKEQKIEQKKQELNSCLKKTYLCKLCENEINTFVSDAVKSENKESFFKKILYKINSSLTELNIDNDMKNKITTNLEEIKNKNTFSEAILFIETNAKRTKEELQKELYNKELIIISKFKKEFEKEIDYRSIYDKSTLLLKLVNKSNRSSNLTYFDEIENTILKTNEIDTTSSYFFSDNDSKNLYENICTDSLKKTVKNVNMLLTNKSYNIKEIIISKINKQKNVILNDIKNNGIEKAIEKIHNFKISFSKDIIEKEIIDLENKYNNIANKEIDKNIHKLRKELDNIKPGIICNIESLLNLTKQKNHIVDFNNLRLSNTSKTINDLEEIKILKYSQIKLDNLKKLLLENELFDKEITELEKKLNNEISFANEKFNKLFHRIDNLQFKNIDDAKKVESAFFLELQVFSSTVEDNKLVHFNDLIKKKIISNEDIDDFNKEKTKIFTSIDLDELKKNIDNQQKVIERINKKVENNQNNKITNDFKEFRELITEMIKSQVKDKMEADRIIEEKIKKLNESESKRKEHKRAYLQKGDYKNALIDKHLQNDAKRKFLNALLEDIKTSNEKTKK